MIKIEKLLDGAKATFIREGKEIPVFAGQILSDYEGTTLTVTAGSVVYSIDESEIVTMNADTVGKEPTVPTDTKSTEDTESVESTVKTDETPTPVVAPAAPKIIKPAPRKK